MLCDGDCDKDSDDEELGADGVAAQSQADQRCQPRCPTWEFVRGYMIRELFASAAVNEFVSHEFITYAHPRK